MERELRRAQLRHIEIGFTRKLMVSALERLSVRSHSQSCGCVKERGPTPSLMVAAARWYIRRGLHHRRKGFGPGEVNAEQASSDQRHYESNH